MMLRRLGQILLSMGLVLGGAVGLAVMLPTHLAGLSWLIALGLAKLTLASSLGLMAGGAVLLKRANQLSRQDALPPSREP